MAEKESERLFSSSVNIIGDKNNSAIEKISPTRPSTTGIVRTNRSAESSPITTMQKKNLLQQREQLFSSHSSPSSSYNKYNVLSSPSNKTVSTDNSPPHVMKKSGSNSSFLGNKNYHGQLSSSNFEKTDTRNLSKRTGGVRSKNSSSIYKKSSLQTDNKNSQMCNPETSTSANSQENSYSVVALEAQRKVSAAVVAGGPKARERRNSFREAVESGTNTENKNDPSVHKKPPKKPYESIWFGKGGEECLEAETENQSPGERNNQFGFFSDEKKLTNSCSMDSTTRPPIYVNTPISASKRHETTQRHYSNISYAPHEPPVKSANVSSSSGYEPVTFYDGKVIKANMDLPDDRSYSSERITPPGGLQCVSLVNEIMNSNRSNASSNVVKSKNTISSKLSPIMRDRDSFSAQNEVHYNKKGLRKQDSSGSAVSNGSGNSGNGNKGPPPPYKQPPRVTSITSTPQYNSAPGLVHQEHYSSIQGPSPQYQNVRVTTQSMSHSNQLPHDGSQSVIEPENKSGTYANVPFYSQSSGETLIYF